MRVPRGLGTASAFSLFAFGGLAFAAPPVGRKRPSRVSPNCRTRSTSGTRSSATWCAVSRAWSARPEPHRPQPAGNRHGAPTREAARAANAGCRRIHRAGGYGSDARGPRNATLRRPRDRFCGSRRGAPPAPAPQTAAKAPGQFEVDEQAAERALERTLVATGALLGPLRVRRGRAIVQLHAPRNGLLWCFSIRTVTSTRGPSTCGSACLGSRSSRSESPMRGRAADHQRLRVAGAAYEQPGGSFLRRYHRGLRQGSVA